MQIYCPRFPNLNKIPQVATNYINHAANLESRREAMDCIYKSLNAQIEDRIKDLLSRMTLKEKIGQMTQIERQVATPSNLRDFSIGSILSAGPAGGSMPFENALSSDWADMVDRFQKGALESRLGIPLNVLYECISVYMLFEALIQVFGGLF